MARIKQPFDEYRHGSLVVEELSAHCVEVFFIPSPEKLEQSELNPNTGAKHRVRLLKIDGWNQCITLFPIKTIGGRDDFLQPKYNQIRSIMLVNDNLIFCSTCDSDAFSDSDEVFLCPRFDSNELQEKDLENIDFKLVPSTQTEVMRVLEGLPPAFTKDYDYGLGLAQPYRFIVNAVEKLSDCTEIVISKEHETGINRDEKSFYISFDDFEIARKTLNNITNLSRKAVESVREGEVYNFFAEKIGQPEIPITVGRHPLRRLFTAVGQGEEPLSDGEQVAVLDVMEKNIKVIAETQPEKLVKLQSDIELATLDNLIVRYEEMINQNLLESDWQRFLNENPFILSLAFGYPIIKVQDQASIGGRKISGSGEKIADFLVKNSMTNNTAIIEIKKPQTELFNKKPFRSGVYTPSSDLSGSISQVLDQKYLFEREIAQIKVNSKIYDIETYSVHCCLIIGKMPSDEDQQKSFELCRRNSKDVEIVTFDELLKKLKELSAFLNPEKTELPIQDASIDLPF